MPIHLLAEAQSRKSRRTYTRRTISNKHTEEMRIDSGPNGVSHCGFFLRFYLFDAKQFRIHVLNVDQFSP